MKRKREPSRRSRRPRRTDDKRPARFERAGDHRDVWTAGIEADAAAGDEGIDDVEPATPATSEASSR
jgi:hypothetical protein